MVTLAIYSSAKRVKIGYIGEFSRSFLRMDRWLNKKNKNKKKKKITKFHARILNAPL